MMALPMPLAVPIVLAITASPVLAAASEYRAPAGVTFLLRDQAIGCYRGYSFSTSETLDDVANYYDRQARNAGLQGSTVKIGPGFRLATYNNATGSTLRVAINTRSKPTTATVMYRGGKRALRC